MESKRPPYSPAQRLCEHGPFCAHCATGDMGASRDPWGAITIDMRTLGGVVIRQEDLDVPAKLRYAAESK